MENHKRPPSWLQPYLQTHVELIMAVKGFIEHLVKNYDFLVKLALVIVNENIYNFELVY